MMIRLIFFFIDKYTNMVDVTIWWDHKRNRPGWATILLIVIAILMCCVVGIGIFVFVYSSTPAHSPSPSPSLQGQPQQPQQSQQPQQQQSGISIPTPRTILISVGKDFPENPRILLDKYNLKPENVAFIKSGMGNTQEIKCYKPTASKYETCSYPKVQTYMLYETCSYPKVQKYMLQNSDTLAEQISFSWSN
jgi:hypothetical protein